MCLWVYLLITTSLDSSDGKESACNAGDPGSIPGLGRSLEEGNGNLLQYSCLENSMDRGAWEATVQGVSKRQTQLSDQHTHMVRVYLVCETSPNYLPKWLYHLHSYQQWVRVPVVPLPLCFYPLKKTFKKLIWFLPSMFGRYHQWGHLGLVISVLKSY